MLGAICAPIAELKAQVPASGASTVSFHNFPLMERSLNSKWMHNIFHFY